MAEYAFGLFIGDNSVFLPQNQIGGQFAGIQRIMLIK